MASNLDISVSSNVSRIKAKFGLLAAGLEEKALVRALNRAGDQSVTESSRQIRQVYNIKSGDVRRQIKVRTRAKKGQLTFTLRVFSKRLPLIEFQARQTKRGVSVSVKRGQRKVITHAFIDTRKSGHKGVYVRAFTSSGIINKGQPFRVGRGSRVKKYPLPDLPIAELFTLSVPKMFVEKSVRAAIVKLAVDSFVRNFEQQLKFLTRDL